MIALAAGAVLAVGGLGGGIVVGAVAASCSCRGRRGALAHLPGAGSRCAPPDRAGPERLIGQVGVVRRWDEPRGKVLVDGALWHARRSWPDGDDDRRSSTTATRSWSSGSTG